MNIVNFMDPIIWNPATREFGTAAPADRGWHGARDVDITVYRD